MNIQQATPYNLVEIAYLAKVCDSEMRLNGCIPYQELLHDLEQETSLGHIYLFRNEYATLGMICISNKEDPLAKLPESNQHPMFFIKYLLVHPHWKNQPVGTDMLAYVESLARGLNIHLIKGDASSVNDRMIGVFEKSGFQKTQEKFRSFQKTPFYHFVKKF